MQMSSDNAEAAANCWSRCDCLPTARKVHSKHQFFLIRDQGRNFLHFGLLPLRKFHALQPQLPWRPYLRWPCIVLMLFYHFLLRLAAVITVFRHWCPFLRFCFVIGQTRWNSKWWVCFPPCYNTLEIMLCLTQIYHHPTWRLNQTHPGAPGGSVGRAGTPYTKAVSSPQRPRGQFHLWPFAACHSPSLPPVSCPLFSCPVQEIKAQKAQNNTL